jgi:transposase
VIVSAEDRARLAAVIGDRNRLQKHVMRARLVLLSADRLPVLRIGASVGVGRTTVWRWQQRVAEAGVDGVLCDKTRPPGTVPLPAETVEREVTHTCAEPLGETTHWTGRAMAAAAGISLPSVQ